MATLSPLEQERNEFGYQIEEFRDKNLRIIRRTRSALGTHTDTCVFFVHGGGGRACQFKHQIQSMEETCNVVAMDFLGHGDSPAPNNSALYTADEHLKDLLDIYMRFRNERNFIVAHCYGGLHTLRLLKQLSDKDMLSTVTGVVLVSIGYRNPVSASWIKYMPASLLEWLRPLARSTSNATIFTPTTDPNLIAFENSISSNNRMYVMKVIGADCSDPTQWGAWLQEAKDVVIREKIPLAVVAGEGDGVFPPEVVRDLANFLEVPEESFRVVPDVGHLVMLEKPDDFTGILKDFMRKLF